MSWCASRPLGLLTVVVIASGCAQIPTTVPAQPYAASPLKAVPETSARPAAHFYGYDLLYASQPADNDIVVYKRKKNGFNLTLLETYATGLSAPMGMVATPAGHLYVANSGASDVLVLRTTRRGPQGLIATLGDSGEVPVNVAVSTDRRLVAVSNASATNGSAGSVSVYLKKQVQPARVLTYGTHRIRGAGIAIDSAGNCYWSFNDPDTLSGSIVEFAGCKGTGTIFKSGILKAGGLAFDSGGNLYYADQLAGVYKCASPSSCSLFTPVGGLLGLVLPTNLNFDDSTPANLWVSDAAGYVDALNVQGIVAYILQTVGGILDPPVGIAPAPGS